MPRTGIGTGIGKSMGVAEMAFSNTLSTSSDGVDEVVNIDGIQTSLASTTVGTWSFWVKPVDGQDPTSPTIIGFGDTNGNEFIEIFLGGGIGRLNAFARKAGVNQFLFTSTNAVFLDDTWTHIMMIQNGTTLTFFQDNVLLPGSFPINLDLTTWFNDLVNLDNGRLFARSKNSDGNSGFFNGNLDEVRFWNIDLNSDQRTDHFNGGVSLPPSDEPLQANLVSSYRMGDNDTFPTITDNTGSNNGTMINMESSDFVLDVP